MKLRFTTLGDGNQTDLAKTSTYPGKQISTILILASSTHCQSPALLRCLVFKAEMPFHTRVALPGYSGTQKTFKDMHIWPLLVK